MTAIEFYFGVGSGLSLNSEHNADDLHLETSESFGETLKVPSSIVFRPLESMANYSNHA